MNETIKQILRFSLPAWTFSELIIWLSPAGLAAIAHTYASFKVDMSDTGQGFHILLMNQETIDAQRMWHFVDSLFYPFILYALALLTVFIILKMNHVNVICRIIVFIILAFPGLWYWKIASYLGGKLLGVQ